ncbi:PH domain-containing protein [Propionicicella superfundia]|uniref:PH domain-containing protein n=1 Tax=Propionicicella superfundia TaxID=348582 RepID=UPI000401E4A2|nr:PH domain-containing protein [Propionicicella superfundia]
MSDPRDAGVPGGVDPAGPDAPPRRTERPHPATPLLRGWIAVLGIVLYLGRETISDLANGRRPLNPLEWRLGATVYYGIAGVLLLILLVMFASWYFTRFVIDEDELRIESGAVFRQSRRIPFTKVQGVEVIQPFTARLFGLAELVIDAGADQPTRLRFLRRDQAYRFRDYLLLRAHGESATVAATPVSGSILQDVGGSDLVITRIGPGALITAALLSSEVYVTILIAVVVAVPPLLLGAGWIAPAALIGLALSAFGYLNKVALTQFNYVLARSGAGLKITRGLTSLTSQALPPRRIQALRISQALLWRPLGLFRVDMDVLGAHTEDMDDTGSSRSSILMPAGRREQVDAALAALWPQADPDAVVLHGSPRRARWLRPVTAHTLRYGADAVLAITAAGLFSRHKALVPHRRVQSVRVVQGPLQRRLGLADVQLHTVGGVISMVAKHLEPAQARAFAEQEIVASTHATSDGTAGAQTGPGRSSGSATAPATRSEALGWPRPGDEPHPGLGFPHLHWR